MRRPTTYLLAVGCLVLAACAAGDPKFTDADPAGFWSGVWHGLIAPVTFVIGLFADGVEIYERTNTGGWYDLGFLIGILCLGAGSHAGRRSRASPELPGGSAHVTIDIDYQGDKPEKRDAPKST